MKIHGNNGDISVFIGIKYMKNFKGNILFWESIRNIMFDGTFILNIIKKISKMLSYFKNLLTTYKRLKNIFYYENNIVSEIYFRD